MADEVNWERKALEQLASDIVAERRAARRWGIFFKLATLAFALAGAIALWAAVGPDEALCLEKCTAIVEVEGELDRSAHASAENVIAGLQAAFEHPRTKGVVLRVNSPGGSPVQAGQIYDEARRLRSKYPNTPLVAVVEEIAASGGYYVAVGAERIYVDKASVVGSIGVILDGFGFPGTLEKIGAERRVMTAGENKAFLDPFLPLDEKQVAYAQKMLDDVHAQFIAAVKAGRGERLKETPDMYSGIVWQGQRAVELGLADAFGTVESVARDVFHAEELVDFTPQEKLTERLAKRFGAAAGRQVMATVRAGGWKMR